MLSGSKKKEEDEGIWHDRDIRFDTNPTSLELRPGEIRIDSINSVEDTKVPPGQRASTSVGLLA